MGKLLSEEAKMRLAPRIGSDVATTAQSGGWGAVSARDCGRLVRAAVELAEENLRQRGPQRR